MPHIMQRNAPPPVETARQAIWRLWEEGYLDDNTATAGLLTIDLGTLRELREQRGRQRMAPFLARRKQIAA